MARGRRPVKRRNTSEPKGKRMLDNKEVFPVRCISNRAGEKWNLIGGFVKNGSENVTIVNQYGRPVPYKQIGELVWG